MKQDALLKEAIDGFGLEKWWGAAVEEAKRMVERWFGTLPGR